MLVGTTTLTTTESKGNTMDITPIDPFANYPHAATWNAQRSIQMMGADDTGDGDANDDATGNMDNTPDADPRDEIITQLTAALAIANTTIAGQRAALAAMLLAVPGAADDATDDETPITEPDEPDLDALLKASND